MCSNPGNRVGSGQGIREGRWRQSSSTGILGNRPLAQRWTDVSRVAIENAAAFVDAGRQVRAVLLVVQEALDLLQHASFHHSLGPSNSGGWGGGMSQTTPLLIQNRTMCFIQAEHRAVVTDCRNVHATSSRSEKGRQLQLHSPAQAKQCELLLLFPLNLVAADVPPPTPAPLI